MQVRVLPASPTLEKTLKKKEKMTKTLQNIAITLISAILIMALEVCFMFFAWNAFVFSIHKTALVLNLSQTWHAWLVIQALLFMARLRISNKSAE